MHQKLSNKWFSHSLSPFYAFYYLLEFICNHWYASSKSKYSCIHMYPISRIPQNWPFFLKWPPFWLWEESGMSLYPDFFVRYCPSSVQNFILVSLKAHFFHISTGLYVQLAANIIAELLLLGQLNIYRYDKCTLFTTQLIKAIQGCQKLGKSEIHRMTSDRPKYVIH